MTSTGIYKQINPTTTNLNNTWTSLTSSGSRTWMGIASSDDGTKLLASVFGGYLYTSTNSGESWTERVTDQTRTWQGVASSSDGTILYACIFDNSISTSIYKSTDSGISWTTITSAAGSTHVWRNIVSSSDGTKLLANTNENGYLYTSIDAGVTWTQRTGAGVAYWRNIASSSDGTKLAVTSAIGVGYIFTSTNSGVTWTRRTGTGIARDWYGIAMSDNGQLIMAGCLSDYLYISTNGGNTWTPRFTDGNRRWEALAIPRGNNNIFIAGPRGGSIYISTNIGVTWSQQISSGSKNWQEIASSYYGEAFTAVPHGDYIHRFNNPVLIDIATYFQLYSSGTQLTSGINYTDYTNKVIGNFQTIGASISYNGNIICSWPYNNASVRISTNGGATFTRCTFSSAGIYVHGDGKCISSGNGEIILAATTVGVYTSTNTGSTFTLSYTIDKPKIAVSYDGTKLFAVGDNGYIYISTDSGKNWIARNTDALRNWGDIAVSGDGTRIIAVSNITYLSTDTGLTWTSTTAINGPRLCSSSYDGRTLLSVATSQINYSDNFGVSWYSTNALANIAGIQISGNGRSIVAVHNNRLNVSVSNNKRLQFVPVGGGPNTGTVPGISYDGKVVFITGNSNVRLVNNTIDIGKIFQPYTSGAIQSIGLNTQKIINVAGVTWNERVVEGEPDTWYSISSSSDGNKLLASNRVHLFTSTNSGVIWTRRISGDYLFTGSSADGNILAAAPADGDIVTSTDSGLTWTPTQSGTFGCLALSGDGTTIVAGWNGADTGQIYVSTNTGINWLAANINTRYGGATSSFDGKKLAVAENDIPTVHTSTDSGLTWTARTIPTSGNFQSMASSYDGNNLIVSDANNDNFLYTSTNSGETWTARQTNLTGWGRVASSSDGSKLIASRIQSATGTLWISTDSGITWINRLTDQPRNWGGLASSSDGNKLAAVVNGGSIYTSQPVSGLVDIANIYQRI